jgi:hypothetical protein
MGLQTIRFDFEDYEMNIDELKGGELNYGKIVQLTNCVK